MAQVRQLDGNILSWVKNEIDTTINQAKQALEAHVEAPDDQSQLQFCLNYLHQVYGTLQMVEIYGASMLAEEMERLIQAIIDKRVTNVNDAYEVLMRGMMQLPDYLEKLQSGQPDYPIILLPLLNDMRAVRNAGLLTENALFSPNLDVDAPIPLERAEAPIDTLARKLRHAYHLGLLDWFRGTDIRQGLKKLAAVIEKLRQSANDPDASRMLWAASGVIESLRDQGIDSSVAVKSLMGQVDRQFKKLIDKGEFALSTEPPRDLLKNLLYYVASSSSGGDRVKEIKQAFNLATVMPDKETLSRARADLSAPNAALMRTVSTVMLDDLTQIKDTLDVFMRSSQRDLSVLNSMGTKLTQMADTLGMLGFGDQRQILVNQISLLQEMAAGKREATETALMDAAAALLGLEEVLTDPNANKPQVETTSEADDSQARSFHDPEQRKLIKRVVDEAKVDLSIIKDAFNEYGRMPKQIQLLKDVPGLLDRIRGSLSILSLDRAANILKSAANYVQARILNTNMRPDNRTLELLADAISSVEYYLESLVDSWGHPTSILEVAEQSLLDLGATQLGAADFGAAASADMLAEQEGNTLVDLAMPGVEDEKVETTQQMSSSDLVDDGQLGSEDPTLIDIEGFDDLGEMDRAENIAEPEVEGSISQEFNLTIPEQAVEQPAVASTPMAPVAESTVTTAAQKSTIADELDDEIVEIFLEEAQEEHGNISRLLPTWQNNPENEATLKDLRRSFHTLKGSGRLVGAADVGEFAWAFENMLNRVIDHTISHTPQMFEILDNSRAKLLDLLQLFRTGGKPGQDVFALMAQAQAISQGKASNAAVNKPAPHVAPKTPVVTPTPPPPAPKHVEPPAAEVKVAAKSSEKIFETPLPSEPVSEEISLEDVALPQEPDLMLELDTGVTGEAPDEALTVEAIELAEITETETDDLADFELAATETMDIPLSIDIAAESNIDEAEENTEIIPLPVPAIDPVLLEIYRKEIESHLANLNECIADWYEGKNRKANPKLVRAVHTIKGSSRTAGVDEIADICGALEDHLRVLVEHQIDVNAELISLIQQSEQYVERAMLVLDIPGSALPSHTSLLAKIEGLNVEFNKAPKNEPVVVTSAPTNLQIEDDAGIDTSKTPDYDTELLEIFLEEGVDILNESDHTLHNWKNEPDNKEHVRALQRQLHTLKGGARMAGVAEIGDLSHSIETMLTAVAEQDLPTNQQMFQVLQKAQDRLVNMLEVVRHNQVPNQANALINAINVLSTGNVLDEQPVGEMIIESAIEADSELMITPIDADDALIEVDIPLVNVDESDFSIDTPTVEVVAPVFPEEAVELELPIPNNVIPLIPEPAAEFVPVTAPTTEPATADAAAVRARSEMVRVRTDLLENLVNFAGEVSIYRSRMEQQNNSFRYNIKELDETVTRLREQLRKFEIETETQIQFRYEEAGATHAGFDPLEMDRFTQMQTLSRGMLESLNDLDSLRSILNNLTRESETLLLQQSRVNTELQEGLMRTRMVPVTGQVPRLRRIVRQAADETGKRAELHIEGAETELDRTILERVMSPIEHMLRNAVAHGIESPEVRGAAAKPDTGTILLKFAKEAGDIVITVADDGRGIDLDAIRAKAIERGMIKADANLTKNDLLDLIMQSGFSTAESITQLSGRGVGMDVVNNEVKQLGGHLDISTEEGRGTQFRISMPVSLSVARALMVHVSENTYAIPLIGVETVERVQRDEIIRLQSEKNAVYRWLENDYRYIHLSSMLGLTELQAPLEEQRRIPLLLIRAGDYRAAVHVDGLIGSREIVVKPVGPQLSTLRGITGATIMGDGSVVLILDLGVIVRSIFVEVVEAAAEELAPQVVEAPEKRVPLVMVVDDSITVRKVTTRFLERNNFRTLAAKDGVDALTQLQEQRPDIMLLDVEMPRMDGFELATNIRNDANLMHLPIIMITSRTGQKHRDRALDIGVNIYMGKPYSEAELLDNINKLLSG